ncbi:MAG TPA: Rrf2 family transcriptional regulator [Bacillota bacterium]|jgi:Rrf2 family protein|nr:Rrf2 family transcriptional regulator [Peptococcaceae bacterium MAG4]NLW38985.1 Rrf2 family transcriptional regulator [Peptococcaceae bacterium]HPZ43391.1 Rrf2 family transcriptional regulator [Bacillota bacterium]HQD76395.1 Rrf2 family transcriptional regulator [Bacillota bacterium]HUM58912.1 Rrf2 family transcriptional regulator [Bacillota bacterium]
MKFSSRARYGLRAMLELALNYNPEETMPLVQIAERQGISEGYLEQMMTLLRKGGLVRSVRGAQGGYRLNREPGKITVGEIVRCLEGPLGPTGCVSEDDPEACDRAEFCVTKILWEKVRDAIASVLDNTTLEDLCQETERIRHQKEANMYYI